MPDLISIYISEQKVKTAGEPDDYVLSQGGDNGTGNWKSDICAEPDNDSLANSFPVVENRVLQPDLESYLPFIMEGIVSLVGQDDKVHIRILRDRGDCDSLILSSV